MTDILSILRDYAIDLPPSAENQAIIDQGAPYFRRLCQLTSYQEADAIWRAAVNTGIAECASDFHRGFAMGVQLWEELHQLPLTR